MAFMTVVLLPILCIAAIGLMALISMSGGNSNGIAMTERMQRREDKVQQGGYAISSTTTASTTEASATRHPVAATDAA